MKTIASLCAGALFIMFATAEADARPADTGAAWAPASDNDDVTEKRRRWKKRVYLANRSTQRLVFQLRIGKRGAWKTFSLNAKSGQYFTSTSGRTRRFHVRISTRGRGSYTYSLYAGKRYYMLWNKRARKWDIRKER